MSFADASAPLRARFAVPNWIAVLFSRGDRPTQPGPTPEETRASRELLHDMIMRCPDSFQSGYDIQAAMTLYPGQF